MNNHSTITPPNFTIKKLWYSTNENDWLFAVDTYWNYVQPRNIKLEEFTEELDVSEVKAMNINEFYNFLYDTYFVWKYTAPNRLATTRSQLRKHLNSMEHLAYIKDTLFSFDKNQISVGLETAIQIHGLGTAGASGLLAVLFPKYFGTVDQFLVRALMKINDLPAQNALRNMHPESLSIRDGVILESILREKANTLNVMFNTDFWTPRRIDKILWSIDR